MSDENDKNKNEQDKQNELAVKDTTNNIYSEENKQKDTEKIIKNKRKMFKMI